MKLAKLFRFCVRYANSFLAFAILTLILLASAFASGPLERVLYTFNGPFDGYFPYAGLVADGAGNLYGTTSSGGAFQCCGTVFKLSPPTTPGAAWTESVIHSFNNRNGDEDGQYPFGTLLRDQQGNLYGTTSGRFVVGGARVFELSPPAASGGPWTETILYKFPTDGQSGGLPLGKLVMDGLGDLFGTAGDGGAERDGVVFELRPPSVTGSSRWRLLVLHSFGFGLDGQYPTNNLVMRKGALYGATQQGGTFNKGIAFKLKKVSGVWQETILYSFTGSEGEYPQSGLMFDAAGNLYGTALGGEPLIKCRDYGCGVVFELSPPSASGDPWTETTLYRFTAGKDGATPVASLVMDEAGNLYGTAPQFGLQNSLTNNNGTVFELSPPALPGGAWTETTLHEFGGSTYGDGKNPTGELLVLKGKFYGTTATDVFCLVVTP